MIVKTKDSREGSDKNDQPQRVVMLLVLANMTNGADIVGVVDRNISSRAKQSVYLFARENMSATVNVDRDGMDVRRPIQLVAPGGRTVGRHWVFQDVSKGRMGFGGKDGR